MHDAYAAVRYDDCNNAEFIKQFLEWHGKASTLFSRHLPANDPELQKFKNIENGNGYVLASQFGKIESPFFILVDRIKNTVSAKLEEYIAEGKAIAATIKYVQAPSGVIRLFSAYSVGNESDYQTWKNKCMRLLELHFKKEGASELFKEAEANFTKNHNAPKYIHDMIGVLNACIEMPSTLEEIKQESPTTLYPVTINVTQNQSQSVGVEIFLEFIKDEISGKHFKELTAIAAEEKDPVKARPKIIDKIKSFGEDVISNILANIITDPTIWGKLF